MNEFTTKLAIAAAVVGVACFITWSKTSSYYEAQLTAITAKGEARKEEVKVVEKVQTQISKETKNEVAHGRAVIDDFYRLRRPKTGGDALPGLAIGSFRVESGTSGQPIPAASATRTPEDTIGDCEKEAARAADLIYLWQIYDAEQAAAYGALK